ncbi:hypothetical protein L228DRAFT_230483 [Xylona heveae TC161]|uniref:Integral membrane protein n=1 Tax=Xylona heveae (strain CBS 132557 / TC161) TaxID=1328760 RepID=A0A165GFS0_XYLHT|nr:hypothetical protein L228DRAFT_230483 [Xylona heveae TC161]KZF22129.1 hypothetical protein L228DRAFT_230483 [Xylona heveae TC161]
MTIRALIPFLVGMMLLTGVCNTLLSKYQDMQCVRHCHSSDPNRRRYFEQPILQTAQMFVGEMGCWLLIGASTVYKHFASKASASRGYQPVGAASADSPESDDTRVVTGDDQGNSEAALADDADDGTDEEGRVPLRGLRIVLLALPACCDIAATTLMNVGLLFVVASIYQMTRGALVLFVGLFSVLFLRRKLHLYQWLALFVVVAGVALVGLAGWIANNVKESGGSSLGLPEDTDSLAQASLFLIRRAASEVDATVRTPEAVRAVIGVLLIAGAQIFTATQFVSEEWILENYALEPLKVVAWEGLFGFVVTILGMIILYFAVGRTSAGRYGYFDVKEGWRQMTHNRAIAVSSILIMISIGGFNFFGLSVTRTVSATSRSTIDTCRTLFIWVVSLGLGWETFKWLQVVGFALLVYGTFVFNDIVEPPMKRWLGHPSATRVELLPEEPIEHL